MVHLRNDLAVHVQAGGGLYGRIGETYYYLGMGVGATTWYTVTVVRNAGTVQTYVNGLLKHTVAYATVINPNGHSLRIGWGTNPRADQGRPVGARTARTAAIERSASGGS